MGEGGLYIHLYRFVLVCPFGKLAQLVDGSAQFGCKLVEDEYQQQGYNDGKPDIVWVRSQIFYQVYVIGQGGTDDVVIVNGGRIEIGGTGGFRSTAHVIAFTLFRAVCTSGRWRWLSSSLLSG